jgi:hypothetical protein
MRGKIICGLIVCLFLVQFAVAYETEISIKTLPNHEVQVTAYDPSSISFVKLDSFKGIADEYGDIVGILDVQQTEYAIIVYVKKEGKNIMPAKKFLDLTSGDSEIFEVAPKGTELIETPSKEPEVVEPEINETEEIEEVEEPEVTGSAITGFSVGDIKETIFSKKVIYSFFGFLGVLVVVFGFFIFVSKKKSGTGSVKVKKLSEIKSSGMTFSEDQDKIKEQERKIKEAQDEIKKIKGDDKINAAKKKLEEDREALRRLESGN